ncbi:MAG: DHA2 family efflux MFS transporter permease subunit [Solirubrobacterales bacterium]|nr:DHA2 family efflux MFS transporter permease subunit [Solirubrobacterales bacterium]
MTSRQRLVLVAAILASAVAAIDGSAVNVALPAIARQLGGGLAVQQWISNAYLLTLGSLILLGGSLGDIFGTRRVFALGVGGFGVCSLLCALAPSTGVLIAARALQGVAGAVLTPSSLAVIIAAFRPEQRGKAIGSWAAWGGIGMVVGPLLGGLLVDTVSWRWIFLINVPLVAVTLTLIRAAVPKAGRTANRRLDVPGAALCALSLAGIVFALIEQPHLGWGDPLTIATLAGGLALFAVFVAYERRAAEPMVDMSLWAERNFSVGNLETATMYAALGGLFFLLAIFLQQVCGYNALEAGLSTLPVTVIMFFLSPRVGALVGRFGPRRFMGAGPLVAGAGALLLLRTGMHTSYVGVLLPALVLFAIGLAMTVAPLTTAVLAGAGETNAGIASAINNAVARVASMVAVSVFGLIAAGSLPGDTFARTPGSVSGFHNAVLICVGLFVAGGLAAAAGITSPGRPERAPRRPRVRREARDQADKR